MGHKTKEARAAYHKAWYAKPENKAKQIAQAGLNKARARAITRPYVKKYKQEHPCVRCGQSDFRCLHFHHKDRRTKFTEVPRLVQDGYPLERVIEEIEKCEILCANCHNILHYDENHSPVAEQVSSGRLTSDSTSVRF